MENENEIRNKTIEISGKKVKLRLSTQERKITDSQEIYFVSKTVDGEHIKNLSNAIDKVLGDFKTKIEKYFENSDHKKIRRAYEEIFNSKKQDGFKLNELSTIIF
jgi:hypothetical protein